MGDQSLREVKAETLDDYRIDYAELSAKAKTLGMTAILDQYKRKTLTRTTGIITLD